MSKAIRTIAAAAFACALALSLAACGQSESGGASGGQAAGSAASSAAEPSLITQASGPYASGIHHATVQVKGYPTFTIELDADAAPVTVANFCSLAEQGYYENLALYRIVEGFCVQGGTLGNAADGHDSSLTPIVGEFAVNGIENSLAEGIDRGVVAMARTLDPNSATSTFFISLADKETAARNLDGQYAAFGTIDEAGMAVVDQIVSDFSEYATGDANCIEDAEHMPIMESVAVID